MMNRSQKVFSSLAALAVSAAVLLTGCSKDASESPDSSSAVSADSTASVTATPSTPSGATAAQTSELLSSLTAEEMEALISGSTTLAQLEQKRFDLPAVEETVSSETQQPSDAPASSSQTTTTEVPSSYDTELQDLINQLYAVKARAEDSLNSAIASAKSEYHALPESQQTQTKKLSIVMSKSGELKKLESSCDKEVNSIVSQLRTLLQNNGQSTELADQALASYKAQKSALYNSLKSQLMG